MTARALLLTYLRPEWRRVLLMAALLLSGIALQLANPQVARAFIDQVQAGQPLATLLWTALLFLAVALLTQVAAVAETYVAEEVGWRTTNALRADLARHVLALDAPFHAEHTPGELIERIDGDVAAIADFFARFVVHVVGSGLFLVGVLGLLWREDWRVGVLLTLFALVAGTFMAFGGGRIGERARAARQATAELSGYLGERLGGLPDIKTSGADDYVLRRLHERLAARFRAVWAASMATTAFQTVVGVTFVLGTGAALALGLFFYDAGAITLGTVYLVFRYTGLLREPLEQLNRQMNTFQAARGGIGRVRELLATRARISGAGGGVPLPAGPLGVELDGVSFAYGAEPVLRDVSCRLQAGEVLGLLGRTGSGKTTIARLLFRLHDPADGAIRLGGVDLRAASLEGLRARVGYVTQDVQLFAATLRDNVALFDPTVSDARLREVFAELGLDDWLRALPAGLDTALGAAGRGLSAGEAQLVAFARVFLKDPGLVVLDEASSRLDPTTEQLLERAIDRLLAGRTAVVIAHRLGTVGRADYVLVLDDGRVAELGRRAALAADPTSRLARLQRAGDLAEVLA